MPVHVLTGRSGAGKSAFLIRPLRWVVMNRPMGEEYRRWGSDETRVDTYWDNQTGHLIRLVVVNFQCHEHVDVAFADPTQDYTRVSRIRSNKRNVYEMQHGGVGGEVQVYQIAGDKRVPEPVAAYLNMFDINFQFQHDSPYLLGLNRTPFELARILNDLAGMGEMDEAMSNINGRYRREKAEADRQEAEVTRLTGELAQFDLLDDLDVEVILAESAENELGGVQERAEGLRGWITGLDTAQREMAKFSLLEPLRTDTGKADAQAVARGKKKAQSANLYSSARAIRQTAERIGKFAGLDGLSLLEIQCRATANAVSARTGKAKGLRGAAAAIRRWGDELAKYTATGEAAADIAQVEAAVAAASERIKGDLGKAKGIRGVVGGVEMAQGAYWVAVDELQAVVEEYTAIMPEVCPLCDRPIHEGGECG